MARLLTIKETARELSVSPDTIRRLIYSNELAATRVSRRILVPASELDRVAAHGVGKYARGKRADRQ
jgi:excisionase family DNA binding protein